MVLAELGGKLRDSLRKLHSSSGHVDEAQLNTLLGEISRALIESDVNVKLVMGLRDSIKTRVSDVIEREQDADPNRQSNVSKLVQKTVVDELTALLTPEAKPYNMKRGKPNVVLFVGLQGAGKTTSIAKFANYYQRKGWKTASKFLFHCWILIYIRLYSYFLVCLPILTWTWLRVSMFLLFKFNVPYTHH